MKIGTISTSKARERLDKMCAEKNAAMPEIQVTRKVLKKGEQIVQTYVKKKKAVSDGAQQTAKSLIHSYATHMKMYGGMLPESWSDEGQFKTLWTNCVKLATYRQNISDRTARRHIRELQKIGVIVAYKFHGSRSDFEVEICPEILYGELRKPILLVNKADFTEKSLTEIPSFQDKNDTNCPDKLTMGIMENKNKATYKAEKSQKLRLRDGKPGLAKGNVTKGQTYEPVASMVKKGGGGGGEISENFTYDGWRKEPNLWRPPVAGGKFLALERWQQHYVQAFWKYAKRELYGSAKYTPYEEFAAMDAITEGVYKRIFDVNASDRQVSKFHRTKLQALRIAKKYYEKNTKHYPGQPYSVFVAGKGYFDYDNPKGFKVAMRYQAKAAEENHEEYIQRTIYLAVRHMKLHSMGQAPKLMQAKTYRELFDYKLRQVSRFGIEHQQEFLRQVSTIPVFKEKING